jgi:hypothetical protein
MGIEGSAGAVDETAGHYPDGRLEGHLALTGAAHAGSLPLEIGGGLGHGADVAPPHLVGHFGRAEKMKDAH